MPGFFASRKMDVSVIETIKSMRQKGKDVRILSSVYQDGHSMQEKKEWLKRAGLQDVPAIFVPYGEDKFRYIDSDETDLFVLVDDFSWNLHNWEKAGDKFLGIKYMNGVNGTKGTWTGYRLDYRMTPKQMERLIVGCSEYGG